MKTRIIRLTLEKWTETLTIIGPVDIEWDSFAQSYVVSGTILYRRGIPRYNRYWADKIEFL